MDDRTSTVRRLRITYALLLAAIIVAGLLSRSPALGLPWPIAKWSGSILWASMVYLLMALLRPAAPARHHLAAAMLVAAIVEFSRLYAAPWLDDFRRSTLGALTIGRIFSPWNLLAYATGIGAAWLADTRFIRARLHGLPPKR